MVEIFIVIITLLAVVYILLPLLHKELLEAKKTSSNFAELERKTEVLNKNIADLEFDYQMGKISEDDYKFLRDDYFKEINTIYKETKNLEKYGHPPIAGKNIIKCPGCGKKNSVNNKFCSQCGYNIGKI